MTERPTESKWLYQPSADIVQKWLEHNAWKPVFPNLKVLDSAVVLLDTYTKWQGSAADQYSPDQVTMVKDGPEVPRPGSRLWQIKQDYTNSAEGKADRNGPKGHLHSFTTTPDGALKLRMSDYDWHGLKALGIALQQGRLPERYRDNLLPTKRGNTYTFRSVHPNNTNSHCVIITADNHVVLATRGQAVDYYKGHTAATVEQQTNPKTDNSPFDSYHGAVSKLSSLAELNLTPRPETLRLGAIFLEPDVNCAAFLIVGRVEEDASQINSKIIGKERAAEFSPSPNSVWTLPLDKPDTLLKQFYHPNGFLWHGTTRLRIVAALSYIHGYEETMDRLYKASSKA